MVPARLGPGGTPTPRLQPSSFSLHPHVAEGVTRPFHKGANPIRQPSTLISLSPPNAITLGTWLSDKERWNRVTRLGPRPTAT